MKFQCFNSSYARDKPALSTTLLLKNPSVGLFDNQLELRLEFGVEIMLRNVSKHPASLSL